MTSLHKQLILEGLKIPSEIIRSIKDYTFMDTTMSTSKKHKNIALHLISNTEWSGKKRPRDEAEGLTLFWIEEDVRNNQMQIKFCTRCGNYISHTQIPFEDEFDIVACRCLLE